MRGPRPHQLTMKDNRVSSQRPNPTDSDQSRTGKRTTQKQPTTVTRASGHPSQHASNQHASGRAGQRADRHASGQRQKQTHASMVRDTLYTIGHKHILVQMTKMPLECTSNLLVNTIQSILINTEDCSESSIEERAHAGGAC